MDSLILQGHEFSSRLLIGTGKYSNPSILPAVCEASNAQMVTVALRRIDSDAPEGSILDTIPKHMVLLPNTSGARTAEEAVRIARLARAAGCGDWIKIEVIQDNQYLLPDNQATIEATRILAKEGFIVLPYMNADLTCARRLQEAGAAAVMPLAAPIGSNRGLTAREMIAILIEQIDLPVIVDAGLGSPSQACEAMEMGAAAVLVNTAIATAPNPIEMARAFKWAVQAGRLAFETGLAERSLSASASSPLTGFLGEERP